jgi:hypothetical protein
MAIFDQEHRPPASDAADTGYAVIRAALGGIPVVGPAAQELLQMIIAPPLARRQAEWAEGVGTAIRRLEAEKGIKPDALRDNPAFIDAVLAATQVAIRTSQEEKRKALLNAITNAALPGAPDVSEQQMFIALVERMTEWHIRVLRLFQNPAAALAGRHYQPAISGSLAGVIEAAYPELQGRRELCDQVWSDLGSAGLHRSGSLQTMMTPNGTLQKRTTELGDRFLEFIRSPLE